MIFNRTVRHTARWVVRLTALTAVLTLTACAGGSGGGGSSGGNTNTTFTIGGSVTGLTGSGLVLQNNGGDNLAVSANGSFTFSTPLANSAAYTVTVLTQPSAPAQICSVANGSGTVVGNNIVSAAVTCVEDGTMGGEEQVAPDMTGVAVTMTMDERRSALAKVTAAWPRFRADNIDKENSELAAYISTLPEFADAGVSPDKTVWARYKDGLPVVFHSYRRVGQPADPTVASANSSSIVQNQKTVPEVARSSAKSFAFNIPQKGTAILIDADGIGRGGPAKIAPWLTNAGYSPRLLTGSLADLQNSIKNVDVLYFSTHGYFGTAQNGKRTYVVSSSDQWWNVSNVSNDDWLKLDKMYRDGLLLMVSYERPNGSYAYYWAITEAFVRTYWSFTKDSLIVIDACSLFDISTPARAGVGESFRSALQNRSANATTIVGWSGLVEAGFAADTLKLFFDRVLGANSIPPPETPLQRPFPYSDIYAWMAKTGQHIYIYEEGSATLTLEARGSPSGQLRPTISHVNVLIPGPKTPEYGLSSTGWVLEILGKFGPDPGDLDGQVTLNGIPQQLIRGKWEEQRVLAEYVPLQSGKLVVSVRGHESNAVPLTKWVGTVKQTVLNYDELDPAAKIELTCPGVVQGVGTVNAFRNEPAGSLRRGGAFNLRLTGPCSYLLSGTWTDGNSRYELSGSGQLRPIEKTHAILASLISRDTSPALPTTWLFGNPLLEHASGGGWLTITDLTSGEVSFEPKLGRWLPSDDVNSNKVNLNTNFSFTGSFDCSGSGNEQCTETWNLTPDDDEFVPKADTQS